MYPFGNMRNGYSLWKKIETVEIEDLEKLKSMQCVVRGNDYV